MASRRHGAIFPKSRKIAYGSAQALAVGTEHRTFAGTLRQPSATQHAKAHAIEGKGCYANGRCSQNLNSKLVAGAAIEDAPVYQRGLRVCSRHTGSGGKETHGHYSPARPLSILFFTTLCDCHKGLPTAVSHTY